MAGNLVVVFFLVASFLFEKIQAVGLLASVNFRKERKWVNQHGSLQVLPFLLQRDSEACKKQCDLNYTLDLGMVWFTQGAM